MDELAKEQAFMSAVVTEHFVLQSAASTTVGEAASRASLYVVSLSSSLVAMGFALQSKRAFVPLTATVLPAVVLLGLFTVVRLVDTGVENALWHARIARLRRYYFTLSPEAAAYLAEPDADKTEELFAAMAIRRGPLLGLFTIASMVAAINSVVIGAGVGLLGVSMFGRGHAVAAAVVGVGAALPSLFAFYIYQQRRYSIFEPDSTRRAPGDQSTPAGQAID